MSQLEVRTIRPGYRGVFATQPILAGELVTTIQGWTSTTEDLDDSWFALQIGPDRWLCSDGQSLDDCVNHSCDPNLGFTTGEPILFALRDISPGDELTWDYSTSLSLPEWSLDCLCGSPNCRGVVLPWGDLAESERHRLQSIALAYLRP